MSIKTSHSDDLKLRLQQLFIEYKNVDIVNQLRDNKSAFKKILCISNFNVHVFAAIISEKIEIFSIRKNVK